MYRRDALPKNAPRDRYTLYGLHMCGLKNEEEVSSERAACDEKKINKYWYFTRANERGRYDSVQNRGRVDSGSSLRGTYSELRIGMLG